MKLFNPLLLISLLQLICGTTDCQEQSVTYTQTKCIVYFFKCTNQNKIKFLRCKTQNDSGDTLQINNQKSCIDKCCAVQINSFNTLDQLNNCRENQEQQQLSISFVDIFFAIIFISGCLLCVCSLCVAFCRYIGYRRTQSRNLNRNQTQERTSYNLRAKQQVSDTKLGPFQNQFVIKGIRKKQKCCICLDSGINCLLGDCLHRFHLVCILQWLLHSSFCPLCHSKSFTQIRFYCIKCYKNFVSLKWNGANKQQCNRMLKQADNFFCIRCEKRLQIR